MSYEAQQRSTVKSVLTQQDRVLMPPLDSASACPVHLLLQVGREMTRGPQDPFHSPPAPSRQRPGNKSNRICVPGTVLSPLTFSPTCAEVAMATPPIKKLTP